MPYKQHQHTNDQLKINKNKYIGKKFFVAPDNFPTTQVQQSALDPKKPQTYEMHAPHVTHKSPQPEDHNTSSVHKNWMYPQDFTSFQTSFQSESGYDDHYYNNYGYPSHVMNQEGCQSNYYQDPSYSSVKWAGNYEFFILYV